MKKILLSLLMTLCILVQSGYSNFMYASASNVQTAVKGAYELVDENFAFVKYTGKMLLSGWDVEKTGGYLDSLYNNWFKIVDTSKKVPVVLKRKFSRVTDENITVETRLKQTPLMDGSGFRLLGGEEVLIQIKTDDGKLCYEDSTGKLNVLQPINDSQYTAIKVNVDLTGMKADIWVNGSLKATNIPFMKPTNFADQIIVHTGNEATGEMFVDMVKIYKGYPICERFLMSNDTYPSEDWKVAETGGKVSVEKYKSSTMPDIFSLKLLDSNNSDKTSIERKFKQQTDVFDFECKFFMPDGVDGAIWELKKENQAVLSILADNGNLMLSGDKENRFIEKCVKNLWYHIKVRVNIPAGTADIYLNGKKKIIGVNLSAKVDSVDTIYMGTANKFTGVLLLDDIIIREIIPEPADYVAAPVPLEHAPYNIGIQNCSMWREGNHLGWDKINPFPDRKPFLGWYDEGNPEVADWEIKWLLEHGIDYQMFCWFRPINNDNQPIKDPYLSYALHDGFFNAKYSDMAKFMIMWENNADNCKDSNDFRTNIVPYWMEYYFKDPRYLKINNKPVVSVYLLSKLKKNLGGTAESTKVEMDYLREACKQAGFDGAIILSSNSSVDAKALSEYKACGIDAVYAYSWGYNSGVIDVQKTKLNTQKEIGAVDILTTVGMGRDDTAWTGVGGTYATIEDYHSLLKWAKDEYMPSLNGNKDLKNMIVLDNWNEFGEGHFMQPTPLNGFGYLDAVADVFGGKQEHQNIVPTEEQKSRINQLYMSDRVMPNTMPTKPPVPKYVLKKWSFDNASDTEGWNSTKEVVNLRAENGKLNCTSTGSDPSIFSADNLNIDVTYSPYMKIVMKNPTSDFEAQMFYITDKDTKWDEAKSSRFFIRAKDDQYREYYIDFWTKPNFLGNLKQLRLDPSSSVGEISIDSIEILTSNPEPIYVKIDGNVQKYTQAPAVINGRTLVPLRGIFEALGATVNWDGETSTITASKENDNITLQINNDKASKNDETIQLDQPPVLINNQTLVPVRFISEALGAKVEWLEEQRTVSITTAGSTTPAVVTPVAGTPAQQQATSAGKWEFNTEGNAEGWVRSPMIESMSVKGGYLNAKSTGTDPIFMSPSIALDATQFNSIKLKYKNGTAGTRGQLFYITDQDGKWSEDKSFRYKLNANDSNYTEYVIDTTASPNWKGKILQLRFDPMDAEGDFSIDSIIVGKSDGTAGQTTGNTNGGATTSNAMPVQQQNLKWDFEVDGNSGGWLRNTMVDFLGVKGGYYNARSNGNDPVLMSPVIELDSTKYKFIKLKYKNGTSGTKAQIYYITNNDGKWSEDKSFRFKVNSNDSDYTEYVIDTTTYPNWIGRILQLRFDPSDTEGNFSIDYISLVNE